MAGFIFGPNEIHMGEVWHHMTQTCQGESSGKLGRGQAYFLSETCSHSYAIHVLSSLKDYLYIVFL